MSENSNWTATTSTGWIHISPTAGTAGDEIRISADTATSPYEDSEGFVTITSENSKVVRRVERCLPTISCSTAEIKFEVTLCPAGYDESDDCWSANTETNNSNRISIGVCSNGSSGTSTNTGIRIRNIVLEETQVLDNGSSTTRTTPLNQSDVNILYYIGDDSSNTSASLQTNTGKTRPVTLQVEYLKSRKYESCNNGEWGIGRAYFSQQGYIKDDDTFNTSIIIPYSVGYAYTSYDYDFDFDSSDKRATTCSAGTFEFICSGHAITRYEKMSGRTLCGDVVFYGEPGEDTRDLSYDDFSYYVSGPPSYGFFSGSTPGGYHNFLYYSENTSLTNDRHINIIATLNEDNTKLVSTDFMVPRNDGSCGDDIHIWLECASSYMAYGGTSTQFTYYLYTTDENGAKVIVNDGTEQCLDNGFICPNHPEYMTSISCNSKPTKQNGVYKKVITFGRNNYQNGNKGIYWDFEVKCDEAVNSPVKYTLYQANKYEQKVIPNCDYFTFSYVYNDGVDGSDIDMLARINNCPGLEYENTGENVSGYTIGMGGTAHMDGSVVRGVDNSLIYLKYGADTIDGRCSGEENAIVCFKDILRSGQISEDDTIYVDMYASWCVSKGNGNMQIEYSEYDGLLPEGTYNSEMMTEKKDGCVAKYNVFKPIPGVCEPISNAQNKLLPKTNVRAYGSSNSTLAKNVECIDNVYTHVARLQYNVKANLTSIYANFEDTGIITFNNINTLFYINGSFVDSWDASNIYTDATEKIIQYRNFYIKQTFMGRTEYICPLDDDNEILNLNAGNSTDTYKKEDIDRGRTISSIGFISDFNVAYDTPVTIDGQTIKTLNISFKYNKLPYGSDDRSFTLQFVNVNVSKIVDGCETIIRMPRITIAQSQSSQHAGTRPDSSSDTPSVGTRTRWIKVENDYWCDDGVRKCKYKEQKCVMSSACGCDDSSSPCWWDTGKVENRNEEYGGTCPTSGEKKAVASYNWLPSRYNFPYRMETVYCNGSRELSRSEFLNGEKCLFMGEMYDIVIGNEDPAKNCVDKIGDEMFRGCHFPTSVGPIGSGSLIEISNNVKEIGDYAFFYDVRHTCEENSDFLYDGPNLTSVTIPDGIEIIGEGAFQACPSPSIVFTNNSSIYTIKKRAFMSCNNITSIGVVGDGSDFQFPTGMTDSNRTTDPSDVAIAPYMFQSCNSLTSIKLPVGVIYINEGAFCDCKALQTLDLSDSNVISIFSNAFSGCTNLETVKLPSNINNISSGIFVGCTSLRSVKIPNTMRSIPGYAFWKCTGLESIGVVDSGASIELPDSIHYIGGQAFKNCTGLTSIELPENITYIGDEAFRDCSGLTSITINSPVPPECEYGNYTAQFTNTNECPIYVPEGKVETYKSAPGWETYASRIQKIPTP